MLIVKGLYALFAPALIAWLISRTLSNKVTLHVKGKIIAFAIYSLLLFAICLTILWVHLFTLPYIIEFSRTNNIPTGILFNLGSVLFVYVICLFYFLVKKPQSHNKQFNTDSGADAPPPVN